MDQWPELPDQGISRFKLIWCRMKEGPAGCREDWMRWEGLY